MNKLTNIFSAERNCAWHSGAEQNVSANINSSQNAHANFNAAQNVASHKPASKKILLLLVAVAAILLAIAATTTAFAKYATAETPGNINLTIKPAYAQMTAEASGEGTVAPTSSFYAKIGEAITIDSLNDSSVSLKSTDGTTETTHKITQTPSTSKCCLEKWVLVDDDDNETTIESGVTKVTEKSAKIKGYFKVYECLTLTNTSTTNDIVNITIERTVDEWDYIPNAQYSFDGQTWQDYTISLNTATQSEKQIITLEAGKSVQFKGNNPCYGFSEIKYGWSNVQRRTFFTMSGTTNPCIEVSGHLISIINDGDVASENQIIRQYCFKQMFQDCTLLKSAKNLRLNRSSNGYATNLCEDYFLSMFENCTALQDAPELPVPVQSKASQGVGLKKECYKNMFKNCTSLTSAPSLDASSNEEMADNCYESMFEGCTSLQTAPNLPAEDISGKANTYSSMFFGCTSLINAPKINAKTLSSHCCTSMFQGCTKLANAPELPATTLAASCYLCMFKDCIKLKTAPTLVSESTNQDCYKEMFSGCTELSNLEVNFSQWKSTVGSYSFTNDWLKETSANGSFVCPDALLQSYEPGASTIPEAWLKNPCTLSFDGNAPVGKTVTGVPESTKASKNTGVVISTEVPSVVEVCDPPIVFMYWTDAEDNHYYPGGSITLAADTTLTANWIEKTPLDLGMVIKPEGKAKMSVSSSTKASVTDKISVNDDGQLVVEHTGEDIVYSLSDVTEDYVLQNWSIVLNDGTEKTVGSGSECIDMLTPQCAKVKANFAEYKGLKFKNTSEISDSKITLSGSASPALKYCVDGVAWKDYSSEGIEISKNGGFVLLKSNGWSSSGSIATFAMTGSNIKASGNIMSLLDNGLCSEETSLTPHCFKSAFAGCAALIQAPELPATTLASNCYNMMFAECTSLTSAPELPATSIVGVSRCYEKMFFHCSALNYLKVHFTDWDTTSRTASWVSNVASSGTFVCPSGLEITYTTSTVPSGWVVENF